MARTETVTLTNMCMITDGTRVLVQNRVDPDWSGYTFPGGHVEAGESFTDAVIREVQEETGLTIEAPRLCGIKDWPEDDGSRYIVLLYRADRFTGTLTSSGEGEVSWVELDELRSLPLADSMENMLRVFLEEEISEQYYLLENGKWVEMLK
ncbi:MAG: 8-oxo-dGTP diphosphatase [Clostridiales bacterium]|nr:8-oxo-dGTP diphosphatase [Clostridiales bacterium]